MAAWCRDLLPRRRAARCACDERLRCDAAECPSRFSAPSTARERVLDVARRPPERPFCVSRLACLRVRADVFPRFGTGNFTPARRAFERPMAIACCGDRAPCFPSRTWCISSRTNSPACVLGDFPSRLSSSARRTTFSSGIFHLPGTCLDLRDANKVLAAVDDFRIGQTAKARPGRRVQSLPGGGTRPPNVTFDPYSRLRL